ncbi:putative FAD-binding dehydrogenase [Dissoconium aciculare CBS 342.82]|uniref:FAD-binding dehydrogenase n=1 Tax=Dissoconium aciculare CBS 342.82 TaxID=1314786 RepID=A0A6J3MFX4_9PEZI|nr:putative FAD-binding dehydrogenase [Dissoconium aciculare CBS 342.82]KAF1826886.1 putative FAD-binding dehydrogenase [Dissoconium aciculare CBS 342.82]
MASTEPVIIIGGGLAGLVTAHELIKAKQKVIIVDQENEANLGGQAFWSLGGLFCVNSSDQRWQGIKDSRELALRDWLNTAGFHREEDEWPRKWAHAFVDFATDGMEKYVKDLGLKFLTVGWAERGAGSAEGHGNSVPRFHLSWGTGPEVVRIFAEPVRAAKKGLVEFRFRHAVDEIIVEDGVAAGVRGKVLEPSTLDRGVASSRTSIGNFELRGRAVVIATGGIGGNVEAIKQNWPLDRLGPSAPKTVVCGVPAHVDGKMVQTAKQQGANVINMDRMWHYTEGLQNWNPIWPLHGIRIIPGPSSLWLDANGDRMPPFLFPGNDTLATLRHISATGHDYSFFVLNRSIIAREFALSGSEQNDDITSKSYYKAAYRYFSRWGTKEVQAFLKNGADFVTADTLPELVEGMNRLAAERNGPTLLLDAIQRQIEARDAQCDNIYTKDAQLMTIKTTRGTRSDSLRVAPLHKLLDQSAGPLIAVRLNILTRKSLGGLQTNLESQVLRPDGSVFTGLYAAGEAAGFGGGGVHGYSSLEGTFLGGCIFTGRAAGRALAGKRSQL